MPNKLYNRARMTVASTGTGALTLGVLVPGYQTFAQAGVSNGDVVPYAIEDGLSWEIGVGTYSSSGTSLSRTVTSSFNGASYGTSPISVSTTAQVFITPLAADLQAGTSANNLVQLDGSAKLPAVDGSALTSIAAANITGTLAVSKGGTGVTTSTGSGSNVLSTSPALTTPDLGTPSAAVLTNATGLPLTTGVTGTLPLTSGGTGTGTAFTAGSVHFAGTAGAFSQNNSKLFWDNTNFRLGIGTASPGVSLSVSGTDAVLVPVGTTAQRPTAATGQIRFNSDNVTFEGYNGSAWASVGGGATGGGSDKSFVENDNTITTNYTITTNRNAMTTGPITVNSGATVTVPSGSTWVIL